MSGADHDRIRELFQRAIEKPVDQQTEFLQVECGDNSDLFDAVKRLVDHHIPGAPLLDSETGVENRRRDSNSDSAAKVSSKTQSFSATIAVGESKSSVELLRRTGTGKAFNRQQRYGLAVGLLVLVSLSMMAIWVNSALHEGASDSLRLTMQALLDEQIYAAEVWLAAEERIVRSWTRSPEIVACVDQLNRVARDAESTSQALAEVSAGSGLRSLLDRLSPSDAQFSYAIWNREGQLLADSAVENEAFLGNGATEYGAALLSRVFRGETVLWLPSQGGFITQEFVLSEDFGKPGIALIAPVYNGETRPVAAMLIADSNLQSRFETMLKKARFGEAGESYAFADDGYLITESRFVDQLKSIGLVKDEPGEWSAGVVRVADPGGNMLEGYRSENSPQEWPLTRAATAAINQMNGSDFSGYRDYRGVKVVGVWAWLPRYRFGIATEVDYDTAFSVLDPLRKSFMLILIALGVAALVAIAAVIALLKARQNEASNDQVGPYTLKSLIGEGGFAKVFLADHALLKRPTAVKILKADQMTKSNLIRFEREVQIASGLTHPNTIGIYDYGSTQAGEFYYAMEYIRGLSLDQLIELDGPQKPERVAWILDQVCRSLKEAHENGLVHRDIKPQNIMLCRRGGEFDSVKVLDFGLAHDFSTPQKDRVTEARLLIGTPLYIAPERILDPSCIDARSDIYSLGILGYFLLTGKEPFDAVDSMDALAQTVNRAAQKPSHACSAEVPELLDQLIHDCHLRSIKQRPQSVESVLGRLKQIDFSLPWNQIRANDWWERRRAVIRGILKPDSVSAVRQTIELALHKEADATDD